MLQLANFHMKAGIRTRRSGLEGFGTRKELKRLKMAVCQNLPKPPCQVQSAKTTLSDSIIVGEKNNTFRSWRGLNFHGCFEKGNTKLYTFADGTPMSSVSEAVHPRHTNNQTRVDPQMTISRRISMTVRKRRANYRYTKQSAFEASLLCRSLGTNRSNSRQVGHDPTQSSEEYFVCGDHLHQRGQHKLIILNEALEVHTNVPNYQRKVYTLSEVLYDKRLKLLGHIIRRPRHHPQHLVTFAATSLYPELWTTEG